jgi:hypothetical protein
MTDQPAPYIPVAVINPEDLQNAIYLLANARREALLLELSQIERLLNVSPTTSELRRADRAQSVRLRD